jgi:hypothetical protein
MVSEAARTEVVENLFCLASHIQAADTPWRRERGIATSRTTSCVLVLSACPIVPCSLLPAVFLRITSFPSEIRKSASIRQGRYADWERLPQSLKARVSLFHSVYGPVHPVYITHVGSSVAPPHSVDVVRPIQEYFEECQGINAKPTTALNGPCAVTTSPAHVWAAFLKPAVEAVVSVFTALAMNINMRVTNLELWRHQKET